MFFKQLATKESSLSYFFGCGGKGKSVAVDVVAGDEEWFIEETQEGERHHQLRDRHPCPCRPLLGQQEARGNGGRTVLPS